MVTVTGDCGRSRITRSCLDREEAEQWARQLIEAGIAPVRVAGVPFGPDLSQGGGARPEVD